MVSSGDIFLAEYNGMKVYWLAVYVEYVGEYINIGYISNDEDFITVKDKYSIGYKYTDKVPFNDLTNPVKVDSINAYELSQYEHSAGMKLKISK